MNKLNGQPGRNGQILRKVQPSNLNQEKIENMNRPITSNEIETVIKNLATNKSPGPNDFTGEFYQSFSSFLNYSKQLQRKEHSQLIL